MQDDIRIGNERKFWSENASEYDYSIIENHWKMYPSLLDKNLRRSWRWGAVLEVAIGTGMVALKVALVAD